jgi:pimeloyl-ACP methyl ester carboxylesterase
MVDRFSRELRDSGYDVRDGVFIDGFSAGAMFAQRYALLHPERVRAVAAGQCGGALTLPESRHGDTRLDWPLGVADIEALAGRPFDRGMYRRVPQYVYIGERDADNSTLEEPGEVWPDQSSIDFLNSTFGGTDPVRLANQVRYLRDRGYGEIAFRSYEGVGHDSRPMDPDVLAFFDAHK